MIPTLAKSKISRLQLASEAEQASLSLTWSQMFSHDAAHPGNVKCLKVKYKGILFYEILMDCVARKRMQKTTSKKGAKTFPRNQNGHRNNNSYNNQKSESRFKSQRYRKPRGQNKK